VWEYDFELKPRPWPRLWSWPRPIQREDEMVYRLVEAGKIEPCQYNGINRIASELAEIEKQWRKRIQWPQSGERCPNWFERRIRAEAKA
jgi:hypothetical protein